MEGDKDLDNRYYGLIPLAFMVIGTYAMGSGDDSLATATTTTTTITIEKYSC
jgi:hypothetical protein